MINWFQNINFSGRNIAQNLGFIGGLVFFLLFLWFVDLDPANRVITYTAAVALLMAIWWITEAIPLAVTALMPIVLFPAFGILDGKTVSSEYFNHVIFLFIGGFMVALAMQRWNLHKRIALITLLFFGTKPRYILLGFMVTTALLSMWISNTATAMMMVPIALSVILNLEQNHSKKTIQSFSLAVLLGIAYSASIGGIATLVGTPPNLVFLRIFAISFPQAPEISFTGWFLFALPVSIAFLFLSWLFLSLIFRKLKLNVDRNILKNQYKELGKISYEEKVVLVVFLLLVLSWLFRADLHIGNFVIKGWANLFRNPAFINDGTVAVFYAILLFVIPAKSQPRLMKWRDTHDLPWNIVLLFGGGFALASGFANSGLSLWFGERFNAMHYLHPVLVVASICLLISFLTELTSNTATSQIILPILAPLSISMQVNPLFLMIPVTLASSLAFMMPVATPPNAIVFGSNKIKIVQMVKHGFTLNILGVLLVTLGIVLLGEWLGIDMNVIPAWAR